MLGSVLGCLLWTPASDPKCQAQKRGSCALLSSELTICSVWATHSQTCFKSRHLSLRLPLSPAARVTVSPEHTGDSGRHFQAGKSCGSRNLVGKRNGLMLKCPACRVDTFLPPTWRVVASSRVPQGALLQLHAHQPDGERAAVPRRERSPCLITHLWVQAGFASAGRDAPGSSR